MTDRDLLKQALEALDWAADCIEPRKPHNCDCPVCVASDALRERLAQPEPQTQQRPPNCGTSYCSCIECVMEPEQPEQEPVAWMNPSWADPDTRGWPSDSFESIPIEGWMPLYTTPPRREWVGLTDEEKLHLEIMGGKSDVMLAEVIEAQLREKNA